MAAMSEFNRITGNLITMIFHNESNCYSVARFNMVAPQEKEVTIAGYFKPLEKDVNYHLDGNFVEHPKYGMQFKVETLEQALPSAKEDLIRFFSGPLFSGIGKKMAENIVDALHENAIDLIKKDTSVLDTVDKMTDKKKQIIVEGLASAENDFERTVSFFRSHGIGMRNIMKIDKFYGAHAVETISENPYCLIQDVDGIGFGTADKLAMNLGFERDFPSRLQAALVALVMEMCIAGGDSYVNVEDLPEALKRKCQLDYIDFSEVLFQCLLKRQLIQEENRIYHSTQFSAENGIAEFCVSFPLNQLERCSMYALNEQLSALQDSVNIVYDQHQLEAIECFFKEDCMILTGGPGTGKTTVVKAMVELFRRLYPYAQIACCAPTGRAAKRLAELTGVDCSTIHSLLHWDLETNTFGKNETEPLAIDCLIIDEFSMVDAWLFYNLLKAGTQIKKICIIGDEDQLPSVSCGSVLRDLIETQIFPVVRLETVFRQKEGSGVVQLAHQIRLNQIEDFSFKGDVAFFECDQYAVKNAVLKIVQSALEKGYDINDVQVLAAKYNGAAGIDRLNAALQECLNPASNQKREFKSGYRLFREHDKILQLKNQIDDDVYNGDIGELIEIIYPDEDINHQARFVVDFDGILVEYTQETFQNITHAYCISVHKSQGSEYPIVIMPIVKEAAFMLQKRLIYTGVTRAKKSLILIGDKTVWTDGLLKKQEKPRKTTLSMRILNELNR